MKTNNRSIKIGCFIILGLIAVAALIWSIIQSQTFDTDLYLNNQITLTISEITDQTIELQITNSSEFRLIYGHSSFVLEYRRFGRWRQIPITNPQRGYFIIEDIGFTIPAFIGKGTHSINIERFQPLDPGRLYRIVATFGIEKTKEQQGVGGSWVQDLVLVCEFYWE